MVFNAIVCYGAVYGLSVVQDRSDGVMESSLFMRVATDASFRTYTLHAENSVAVTTAQVTLAKSTHVHTLRDISFHENIANFSQGRGQVFCSGTVAGESREGRLSLVALRQYGG